MYIELSPATYRPQQGDEWTADSNSLQKDSRRSPPLAPQLDRRGQFAYLAALGTLLLATPIPPQCRTSCQTMSRARLGVTQTPTDARIGELRTS
jgi:hypothetical protein